MYFFERYPTCGFIIRLFKIIITFSIIMTVGGIVSTVVAYFYFARDLPPWQNLSQYRPPVISEVFANDGAKIGEFWKERRLLVNYDDIPPLIISAFISSEDDRFFEHGGVDLVGIIRATIENARAGHVVQGASTITQQITRSLLLSREKKLERKIKEAILAIRIERNLSKREIITLYLNQIYLGNRAYGIKAGCENYFHKELSDLSLGEIAILAGLPQAPGTDNPVDNPKRAKQRQHYVLSRMFEEGYITRAQLQDALNESIMVYRARTDKEYNLAVAPYFTEQVRQLLVAKYGEKALYESGLRIYTTLDIKMAKAAQRAIRQGIELVDKRHSPYKVEGHLEPEQNNSFIENTHKNSVRLNEEILGFPFGQASTNDDLQYFTGDETVIPFYKAIITDISNGIFTAQVGHHRARLTDQSLNGHFGKPRHLLKRGDIITVRALNKEEFELVQLPSIQGAIIAADPTNGHVTAMVGGYDFAKSEFNRATQALRQPGSSFKPFIYAAALDKGYTFSSPIIDEPIEFMVGTELWRPKNSHNKFSGITTFQDDLIYSRNIPTIKIANSIGLDYVAAYARKLGITTPINRYLSMALGTNEVYLSEMCSAYTAFANYGKRSDLVYVTKITDSMGDILEERGVNRPINRSENTANETLFFEMGSSEQIVESQAIEPMEALQNTPQKAPQEASAPSGLNSSLFLSAAAAIEREKFLLTPDEIKVLYGSHIPDNHAITPQTAYLMQTLQREVVRRGTAPIVNQLGRDVAGKTGTTNDSTDTWFIGYTPNLLSGVWIGYDEVKSLGQWEQGGRTAAPIFLDFMKTATEDLEEVKFEAPKGFPSQQIATLPGGSAKYWRGGLYMHELPNVNSPSMKVNDRAIDFFGEDL